MTSSVAGACVMGLCIFALELGHDGEQLALHLIMIRLDSIMIIS